MPTHGRAAANSCCGSRISIPAAAGRSLSTASTRTWTGSASTATASRSSSRSGPQLYAAGARPAEGRRAGLCLLLHPRRHRPVADRAAWRCRQPLSRHLPRRCPTIRSGAPPRRIAGGSIPPRRWPCAGLPGWTEEDGTRFDSNRGDIGDAILARKDAPSSYHLACVVDDAASGVNSGRPRRGSAPLDADPAAAAATARPARADLPPSPAGHP